MIWQLCQRFSYVMDFCKPTCKILAFYDVISNPPCPLKKNFVVNFATFIIFRVLLIFFLGNCYNDKVPLINLRFLKKTRTVFDHLQPSNWSFSVCFLVTWLSCINMPASLCWNLPSGTIYSCCFSTYLVAPKGVKGSLHSVASVRPVQAKDLRVWVYVVLVMLVDQ